MQEYFHNHANLVADWEVAMKAGDGTITGRKTKNKFITSNGKEMTIHNYLKWMGCLEHKTDIEVIKWWREQLSEKELETPMKAYFSDPKILKDDWDTAIATLGEVTLTSTIPFLTRSGEMLTVKRYTKRLERILLGQILR